MHPCFAVFMKAGPAVSVHGIVHFSVFILCSAVCASPEKAHLFKSALMPSRVHFVTTSNEEFVVSDAVDVVFETC